jgi:hypothetical protein
MTLRIAVEAMRSEGLDPDELALAKGGPELVARWIGGEMSNSDLIAVSHSLIERFRATKARINLPNF